jgi:hydrogenase expression/formation protein HypC
MCVAVPGRVTRIGKPTAISVPATVSIVDMERDVDLIMVPEATVGDYVVVHSGYAIEVIPRERAIETLGLFGVNDVD